MVKQKPKQKYCMELNKMAYIDLAKRKEWCVQYYLKNKAKINSVGMEWRKKNKLHSRKYFLNYYLKNRDKIHQKSLEKKSQKEQYNKQYYLLHKHKIKYQTKNYYYLNKDKVKSRTHLYSAKNKMKINLTKRKYWVKKYGTDILFKLNKRIKSAISISLVGKGMKKNNANWGKIVGYGVKELKEHLEKQFDSKMSWDNHGVYWDIDHVVPVSWFKTEEQLIKHGWALKNLQPLESTLNKQKSDSFVGNPNTRLGIIYL